MLALLTWLRFTTSAIYAKRNLGLPLNQILDPLLISVKKRYPLDLSHPDILWQLIAHAFVTVCCNPYSNGPIDARPRAGSQRCDYAVVRYRCPYGIGWLIEGRAARWLYLRYRFNGWVHGVRHQGLAIVSFNFNWPYKS